MKFRSTLIEREVLLVNDEIYNPNTETKRMKTP